jgi:hypothetical protein
MPRRKKGFTKATYTRRLKEGRGQGDGAHYLPYIYVQDFSSRGQSNRDFGLTTERQHDLFSKLEHRVYLIFDNSGLYDIKEQYPHPLEISLEIARQCSIRHPRDPGTKEPIPITTDLLLTVPLPIGSKRVARSVKYHKDFTSRRVIEKLELERRCCQLSKTDWGIITERDVDPILVRNLLWAYKFRHIDSLYPLSPEDITRVSKVLTNAMLAKDSSLCDTALICDQFSGLRKGTCLRVVRHLIASRQWRVDMSSMITPTERLKVLHVALSTN